MYIDPQVRKLLNEAMGPSDAPIPVPRYYYDLDKTFRNALESVALAMQANGIAIPVILDVLNTAIDAYDNNEG